MTKGWVCAWKKEWLSGTVALDWCALRSRGSRSSPQRGGLRASHRPTGEVGCEAGTCIPPMGPQHLPRDPFPGAEARPFKIKVCKD